MSIFLLPPCADCGHQHAEMDVRECRILVAAYLETNPARVRVCGCPAHRVGKDTLVWRGKGGGLNFASERIMKKLRLPDHFDATAFYDGR